MDSLSKSAVSGIERTNDAIVSSKVRQFKCQYCSKDFDRYSHLARHLKIHSGLRPFECKYCHKSFSRSDNLIKHVRIHTGDKRYGCEFCLKRFTDSSNLSKHMRTHAGTRRYTCTLCSKTFRKSDTLRRHLLTHGVSDGNGSTVGADDGNGGSGGGGSSTDNRSGEVALRDTLSVGGHDCRGSNMDVSGDTASLLSLSDAAAVAADVQRRLQMQNILHIINKERSFPTMTTTTATTAVSNLQGAQLQSQLEMHPRSRLPSVSKSEATARGILSAIGEPSNEARLLGPDAGGAASKSSYTGNLLQWSDGEDEEIVKAPPKNTTLPIATDVFSRTDHIIRQLSQTNENIQGYNSNNTSSSSSSSSSSDISKMKSKRNRTRSANHVSFDFDQVLSYSANATTLSPNPINRKASGSSRPTSSHSIDRLHHVNSLGRARNRFPITFQCSYCGMQFFSRTSLEMHVKGHVDDCAEEGEDVAPIRIKNEYDDDNLRQVNRINTLLGNSSEDVSKIHVRRRQSENHGSMDLFQTSTVGGATSLKDLDVGSAGLPYECLYCKAAFPKALALADHLKCHIRRRLECKNCGESFSSSVQLSKHRRQCPAQDRNQRPNRSKNKTDLMQQRLLSARLVGGQPQLDHRTMTQDNQRLNPDRRRQLSAGNPVSSVMVVNPSAPKLKQEIILSDSEIEDNDMEDNKKRDSIKDPGNSMLLQHGLNVLDGITLSAEDLTGLSQNGDREVFDALGMVKKKRRQGNKHSAGKDFGSTLRKEKGTQGQQEEEEETGKLTVISSNDSTVEVDAIVAKILSNIGKVSGCDFRRVIKQEVKEPQICRDRKRKEGAVGGISTGRSFQNLMSVDQISSSKSKIFAKSTIVLTDDVNNDDDDVGTSVVDQYSSVAVPRGVVLKTETRETLVSVADDGGDHSQVAGFGSVSRMEVSNRASPTDKGNFSTTQQKETSTSVSLPSTPSAQTPTLPVSRVAMDSEAKVTVKKEALTPPHDRSANHDDSIRISPSHVHTASSKDFSKGDNSAIGLLTKGSSVKETQDVEVVNAETRTTTAAPTTITTTTATTTTSEYDDHDNNSHQSTSSCNSSSNNSCSSTTTTIVTTSSSRGSTAATHTSSTTASAAISTATSAALNTTSTAVAVDSNSPVISVVPDTVVSDSATSTTTTTTTITLTPPTTTTSSSAADLTSSAAADKKAGSVKGNGNKEFSCSYCKGSASPSASSFPVSFSSALELTQHLRWRHLVHACSVCSKHFSKSTQLNRHLKIHAGIKPFRCAYCDRAFSRSDNLVKHVRIHTGDKRYSCSICTKRFTDSSNLTKHLRTHARAAAAAADGATASNKSNSSRSGSHSNSNQDNSFPPHTSTGSSERDDDDDNDRKHDNHKRFLLEAAHHDSGGDDDNSNYEHPCFLSRQQQQNQEQQESRSPLLSPSTELSPFRCMICSKSFDSSIALCRHLLTHAKLGQSPQQLKTLLQSETTSPSPPPPPQQQQHLPSLPCSVPSSSTTDLRSISAAVARAAIGTTNITTTATTTISVIPPSPPSSSSSLLSLSLQSVSSSAKNATSALKKTFGSGPTALLQRFKKQLRDKLHRCRQCGKVFLDEFTLANHIYRFHITTITAASPTIKDGEEDDEEMEEEVKEDDDVGEDKQTGSSEHGQTAPISSQQNICSPMSFSRETSSGTMCSKTGSASSLAIPDDANCQSLCNVSPFMLDYIKQEVLEQEDVDGNQEEEDEAVGNATLTVVGGFKVEMETEMDEYLYNSNNNPNTSDRYSPHHHHNHLHPYINNSDDDNDNDNENDSSHQSQQHQQHHRTHRRLHDSDHHPRNRLFHCSRCQIFFSGVEELTRHLKLHTTGEMFRCKECGNLIHDLNVFNDHLLRDCRGSSSSNAKTFTDTVSLGGNELTSAVSHDDEMDSAISDVNSFDNIVSNGNSLTNGNDLTNSVSKANSILSSTVSDTENLTTAITNSDGSSNTNIPLGHHNSISSVSKTDILSSAVSETESLTSAVTNTSGSSDSNITSASHNLTESISEDSAKLPLQNQLDVLQSEAKTRSSVVSSERSSLSSSSPWHLQFSSPLPSASSSPGTEFGPASSGQDPGSERAALVLSVSSPNGQVQRQGETTAEICCEPDDVHDRSNRGDELRTADGSSSLVSAPRNNMVTTVASTTTTTTTTTINVNSCSNNNNKNYNSDSTINDNNNNNNSDFQESSAENFTRKSLVDPFQENLSLAVKQEFLLPDGSAMKQEPKTPEPDGQGDDGYRTPTTSGSMMELFQWRGGDGGAPLIPSLAAHVREIPPGRGQFEAGNSCGSVGGISRADIKQEVDTTERPMVVVAEGKDVVEDGSLNPSEPFQRSASSDNGELLAGTVSLNENFVFPSALDDEELKDINFKFPSAIDAAEELKNIDLKFSSSENTIDGLKDISFKSQGVRLSYDLLNTTRNPKDAHHTDVAGFYSNADQEPSNSYYDGNGNFRKGTAMVPDKQPEAEKCIQEFLLFDEFVEFRNKNYFSGGNGGPESTLVADQKCKTNNVICISDSNSNSAMSLSDDDDDDGDGDGGVPLMSDGSNYRDSTKNLGFTMTVVPTGSTNTHHADNVIMKQTEDLKDVFESVNVKLEEEEEEEEEEEMSQPCASDILVSSLPEGGFEVDNSNGDVSRANKFPPSQWESNQNDGQFRDAMLDFLSSLSDETLQLLLQKGDKWCDELLHHSVTAAWKPAATTNMDCLPSDVTMTLSAGVNEAGICEDYEDIDNHISVDAAERKSQNLSDQVAADLIMADRPDNTSSYNNDQCIQHDGNNTMHGGNKQSSLMTAKVTPTGSMDAVNCKELNQENRTSKDNLSQPLPNSLSLLSYLQPADNNLDFPKPYIKVEPELATDSDCSAMVPINAKIKTEDLSKFAEAISNTDELASLLSGNQLQAQNNVREMLIERDLSLKSKHNASRFLGNVFTDQLDNNADRKVTFSDLNDDHHELLSSSLPLSSFPSIPADEISYRSNSPSSGGQPFLLNSLNHTLNLASFADKGQAANTSAIDIIARNCGLQMDKPSFDADTTKRHWPQQQQQDQQTASTTATAMMPADLIAPSTTTSLIKALQRKQQQLPRHSGAQSTVKQYTCPQYECRKMFTRPSHLKRHLKVHAGLKPFPCPHCHKWFSRSDNLTKHIRIHTGEKLFSCNFCQKRFSDSSNLTKHVRMHTGEKPYRCVYCSQTFTESRTLSRHMRTHSLMMMMMMEMDMVGGAGGRVRREAQEAGYDIVVGSN